MASKKNEVVEDVLPEYSDEEVVIRDGSLEFVRVQGGNDSKASYQDASGAPVEQDSPLGYQVYFSTAMLLNVGQMIGTGVFSTPATIYTGVGSVGLSLIYWVIGLVISFAGLAVYLELASYFPNRSGAEVVYLEQAYPRPKYFFPTTFAVQTVLLSFSASNSIVLAKYLYALANATPTPWQQKGVAVAGYTVAVLFVVFNNRLSLWVSNGISALKLITLLFISITGLVVLGGHTSVKDPGANFHDAFAGTRNSPYGLTNALVKVIFSYTGYTNAFNLVNEVKRPVRTLKISAPTSLLVVGVLYILVNVAYFAAVPKEEIKASTQIAASLFFQHVFGTSGAAKGLNFLVALSAFGNLVTVLIGQSRVIRECGRQGVLPWPRFWGSTWPFGTPLGPYLLKWGLTLLVILAVPAGDAFNFVVDLSTIPNAVFLAAMSAGLLIIRWRRSKITAEKPEFKAWTVLVVFFILVNVYLIVMPWYPPPGGPYGGDVSFWYATYCVVGVGIIVVCGIYYWVWIYLLPKLGKYETRQEMIDLGEGARTHRLVKVPYEKVEEWDARHDVDGNLRERAS